MTNHKCGTCRFYQEARLASSGWCHHPKRKTTSDLMIMVRKNELACRDEWDHHLWEARPDAGSLAAVPPIANPFADRKMPPATELEIAALLASEQSANGDVPASTDDIFLSELGGVPKYAQRPEPLPSWTASESRPVESPPVSAAVSDTGTRSAIIKAREAYRERSRLEAARIAEAARLAAQAGPASANLATGDAFVDDIELQAHLDPAPVADFASDSWAADRSPARGGLESPPDATATSPLPSIAADVESSRFGPDLTPATDRPPDAAPRQDQAVDDQRHEAFGFDDQLETATPSRSQSYQASEAQSDGLAGLDHAPGDRPDPRSDASGSFEPSELDWFNEHTPAAPAQAAASSIGRHPEPEARLQASPSIRDNRSDVAHDNIVDPTMVDRFRASSAPDESEDRPDGDEATLTYADESWLEIDVVVDDDVAEPSAPAGLELASHLPRICQTCRDFRPAEAGNRGWCANQWAFSHRRMVDAADEVPCDGILGHWWLPVDEVWSEAADVSSHGQPTPLLDAWLPHHREELPARRRS